MVCSPKDRLKDALSNVGAEKAALASLENP